VIDPVVLILLPCPFGTVGRFVQGCRISIGADLRFFIHLGGGRESNRLPYPAAAHRSEDRVQGFNRDELLFAACTAGQLGEILEQLVRAAGGSGPYVLRLGVGLIPPRGEPAGAQGLGCGPAVHQGVKVRVVIAPVVAIGALQFAQSFKR
jgi:hypothetical protein